MGGGVVENRGKWIPFFVWATIAATCLILGVAEDSVAQPVSFGIKTGVPLNQCIIAKRQHSSSETDAALRRRPGNRCPLAGALRFRSRRNVQTHRPTGVDCHPGRLHLSDL